MEVLGGLGEPLSRTLSVLLLLIVLPFHLSLSNIARLEIAERQRNRNQIASPNHLFLAFCFFLVSFQGSPCFSERFPFFPQDLRGSAKFKFLVFFRGCSFPIKKQEKKDQDLDLKDYE